MKVEDAFSARKFGEAGACNGTLDLDLTLATIRQAQPGATLDEIDRRRGFLECPRPGRIGTRAGPPTDSMMQSPSTTAAPWLIVAVPL